MELHESEPTLLWDLSEDVRPSRLAIGSQVPLCAPPYLSTCLQSPEFIMLQFRFSGFLPHGDGKTLKRQALTYFVFQSLAQILWVNSHMAADVNQTCSEKSWIFPLVNIGEVGKGWVDLRNPWGLLQPPPRPLTAPMDGWLFTKLLGEKEEQGGWGQKEGENPLVKGYCLLHFWTGWNHLIPNPHFTDGEMELKGVIWKDYNLLFFYYIMTKFPADIQSRIPPKYSLRLVKGMRCLLR